MTETRKDIDPRDRIRDLLAYDERFRRYQEIPAFLHDALGLATGEYASRQLPWDAPRYDWIAANLPDDTRSVVELGSSLGYFCLRFAHDAGLKATGYEAISAYAEAANALARIAGLSDRLAFSDMPATLENLERLPTADAVVSLNVLHHAGTVFDEVAVARRGGWRTYAIDYLAALRRVAPHLILQTGNSAPGHGYFASADAIPFMAGVMAEAGWQVQAVGVITDFAAIRYRTFVRGVIDDAPRIGCWRNPESGLVEYRTGDTLVAELPFGTLQRPLFSCVRAA